MEIQAYCFKIDNQFVLFTISTSRNETEYKAKQYYGQDNQSWYNRGVTVPIKIFQLSEYM